MSQAFAWTDREKSLEHSVIIANLWNKIRIQNFLNVMQQCCPLKLEHSMVCQYALSGNCDDEWLQWAESLKTW